MEMTYFHVLCRAMLQDRQKEKFIQDRKTSVFSNGPFNGAEGLGQEQGGEPREVGAYQDEMKQVAGIATIKTGCSCSSLLVGRFMKRAC